MNNKSIFWAGDSTVQYNSIVTYPQAGMGQALHLYLKPEIKVCNHAINGRSTKSFIDQGRLEKIKSEISAEDYLFIQFAHNDEKESDPARYTTPFGTYAKNLEVFIDAALDRKAYPILITPIERRCFEADGKLGPGMHGDYVKAMKHVAAKGGVPCIDLYTKSREILNDLGPEEAKKLHVVVPAGVYPHFPDGKDDETHLCYEGAVRYCGVIAEELKKLGGIYREILLDF